MSCCFNFKPKWKRPENFPVGRIWQTFVGVSSDGEPAKVYQIRDLDVSYKDQCLDLIRDHMFVGDPFYEALGLNPNTVSSASMGEHFDELIKQQISLACFLEENNEPTQLVGINFLLVKTSEDLDAAEIDYIEHFPGEAWRKLLKIRLEAERSINIFETYSVRNYLTGGAMTVHLDHRNQGIERQMFLIRDLLCRTFSINAIASVFYTSRFQILASKYGYEMLASLPYSRMAQFGISIPATCGTTSALVMGKSFHMCSCRRRY